MRLLTVNDSEINFMKWSPAGLFGADGIDAGNPATIGQSVRFVITLQALALRNESDAHEVRTAFWEISVLAWVAEDGSIRAFADTIAHHSNTNASAWDAGVEAVFGERSIRLKVKGQADVVITWILLGARQVVTDPKSEHLTGRLWQGRPQSGAVSQ